MDRLELGWLILMTSSFVTAQQGAVIYLEWIERTSTNAEQIDICDYCTSREIHLPVQFPFANFNSLYISTNGLISFGSPFTSFSPVLFPQYNGTDVFRHYIIAPYWADHNTERGGFVSWKIYNLGESYFSNSIIESVNTFIRTNTDNSGFVGSLVFVANWNEVSPFSYSLNGNNSYQAVLVTNGYDKSFAIFTYKCGEMDWSGRATIGFNAGGEYYANHPLGRQPFSNAVACLNSNSEWNNIVYDLTDPIQSDVGLVNQGPKSLLCSNESVCQDFYREESIMDCCSNEGAYTYILDNHCQLCYEYGWVGQISDDRWSAVPQSEVNVTEGESVELNIYFLQNGPSSSDFYTFTMTSSGSAERISDYSMVHIQVLELTDESVPVTIVAVDDNVYEGTEVIYLRLTQTNSSNDVTHGLVHPSITIILEDNDKVSIEFSRATLSVGESTGDVTVSVVIVGNTAITITVDIVLSGTSTESEDYTWSGSHTFDINEGDNQINNVVSIVNDDIIEKEEESLIISLTNPQPPESVLSLGSMIITIINDDLSHISFEEELYATSEAKGSVIVNVCVSVSTGPVIESLTINVDLMPSSATEEEDFQFATYPPTITVAPGMNRGCLSIYILSSEVVERNEEILLSINEDITKAIVDGLSTTKVVIEDHAVVLGFERESYNVTEGSVLQVIVSKSAPCEFELHFGVHTNGLLHEERIFEANSTTALISVAFSDDDIALEPDENYVLTLFLVAPDSQVEFDQQFSNFSIIEDDDSVTVGFVGVSETVSEDGGTVSVTVSLKQAVAVLVAVDVVVLSGSATQGKDFNVTQSSRLEFLENQKQSYFVTVLDDDEKEESETFILSLIAVDPTDQVLISPGVFTFTITDNDKSHSSLPTDYILILSLVVVFIMIAAVVVAGVICIYCRRRQQRRTVLKVPPLECPNSLSDHNVYDTTPKAPNKVGNPALNKSNDDERLSRLTRMGIALPQIDLSQRRTSMLVMREQRTPTVTQSEKNDSPEQEDDEALKEEVVPLPKVDLSQLDVQPNVAYGCVRHTGSSAEYAVPQQLFQQPRNRARNPPLRPSEQQSVEAYAITTL